MELMVEDFSFMICYPLYDCLVHPILDKLLKQPPLQLFYVNQIYIIGFSEIWTAKSLGILYPLYFNQKRTDQVPEILQQLYITIIFYLAC